MDTLRKSAGHMGFTMLAFGRVLEAYEQGGQVYLAEISNVFDQSGCRLARWESSRAHWDHYFWTVHAAMFQHV